ELEHEERKPRSVTMIIFWIVSMNMVFSFDSILAALALTDVFWVMAVSIVIGGLLMIWLADRVAHFLQKNRMYEVLGLFILLVVGIMLLTEGGHLAHLQLFGHEIVPMTKATFYFVIGVLVLTEIAQSRYQKKLARLRHGGRAAPPPLPS
ncbi:MAG: TerC family protein, partial [Planctomycetota bacterium]